MMIMIIIRVLGARALRETDRRTSRFGRPELHVTDVGNSPKTGNSIIPGTIVLRLYVRVNRMPVDDL